VRETSRSEWQVVTKNADGEAVIHNLHGSRYEEDVEFDQELLVSQAPPIRINPTKRKVPDSEYDERIYGIGDIHFPFHDARKLALTQLAVRELYPTTIVLLGDNLDNAMFSRFETRGEWAGSTQQSIDQYAEFLGQLRADAPEAKIIWHEGNHDLRVQKQVRNYNGELLGIRRAGESLGALSLEFLLRCAELDVEYVSGYPTSEYWHGDNFKTHHGHVTNSTGMAASKVIRDETVSFMTGHTHQAGIVQRTLRVGREERTIYGIEAGTYADPNKIPSGKYSTTEAGNQLRQSHNWQTAGAYILRNEAEVVPYLLPIGDDIDIFGKRYSS
jgi:hypothetical protein